MSKSFSLKCLISFSNPSHFIEGRPEIKSTIDFAGI